MIYETERLLVRAWDLESDVEGAFAMYGDAEVMRYLGIGRPPIADLEEQRERLAAIIERNSGLPPEMGYWAAIEKDTNKLIGASILKPLPSSELVEVGWHLAKDSWGKGYATEMGAGAIDYGFTKCGLEEIYAIVYPENERSMRVAQKLGMDYLGTTTEFHDLELCFFKIPEERWAARPSALRE